MHKKDLQEFKQYCSDHYQNFQTFPLEFVTSDDKVINEDECWNVLETNNFFNLDEQSIND